MALTGDVRERDFLRLLVLRHHPRTLTRAEEVRCAAKLIELYGCHDDEKRIRREFERWCEAEGL